MEDKLIISVGAHTGRDTEFYLKKGFTVIAIEANPYCCKEIHNRLNFYEKNGQLILVEEAISDKEGEIEFLIHKKHTDWGTLNPEWNAKYSDEIEKIIVPCFRIDKLIERNSPIYYMKIDIEGADIICLKQLKGLELPKYISVELLTFNNILDKNVNCLEIINALLDLGYKKFQIVDQGKNHLTKCPHPAREGKYVNYKFDGYCSGLFGKELPEDKWTDIEEILFKYFHYFYQKPNCCGESLDENSWFDLHCFMP